METEIIFGIITITLTLLGLIIKISEETKKRTQVETIFQVKTEEQLKCVLHRLQQLEKIVDKLESTIDDVTEYMSSNSDWHNRRK
ncbi:hypothetical protein [Sphaerospermopsis sp. LEGE 08334]|uniref:hypothetical protein n=1 Tax=Sphaerospermopsis sp. LEGE 08334 TaxID=1828651 RepID=UPI0018803AAB|nr:hypothetical protein [Sphaerospermopsis sp. LEGE 08334]MBE9059347.1 hypothetical protein [Sphaerospermopsis sp. LEGE 08334]